MGFASVGADSLVTGASVCISSVKILKPTDSAETAL